MFGYQLYVSRSNNSLRYGYHLLFTPNYHFCEERVVKNWYKIFEKVIYQQLYAYFENSNLCFKGQYGFRKGHSTEMASLELVDRILSFMDDGYTHIGIFLDLSKAFDTLNHNILLHKLKHYGLSKNRLDW